MPLSSASQPSSAARSAAAVSVVKNGLPVLAHRASADVGLADRSHRDRRQDPGLQSGLLEHALHRERVDHSGEHAHVIAGCALDAVGDVLVATDHVAAADHQALLDALSVHAPDFLGQATEGRRIVTEAAIAHERLTRHLQEHPAKAWQRLGHLGHRR